MFWTQGAKVSQESFAPPKPCFAPVQLLVAPVQVAFGTLGPKHFLHPLSTTFGKFLFSGPLPGPWGRNPIIQPEAWLVHVKVREPHLNPPVHELSWLLPFKTRARGRKFIRTGGFRCGSRTFARTSHVSDWIIGRGTEKRRISVFASLVEEQNR